MACSGCEIGPLPPAGEGARLRRPVVPRRNVDVARRLRRADATEVEKRLWQRLRDRQLAVRFRRQHQVGPYVVDFVCLELALVIELDGGQHSPELDETRTRFLESKGFHVRGSGTTM